MASIPPRTGPPQARVDKLVKHITQQDADYSNIHFHRTVYSYVKDKIVPTASSSACPPLPVIVYAIRNILEPTCLPALVPRLLQLLAHLEAIRTDSANKIRTILDLDASSSDSGAHNTPSLSKEDREVLETLVRPSRLQAQRTIFRKLIHGCCMLHIHHLWRTFDPNRDPPLTAAIIDYFPAFLTRDPDPDLRASCARALAERPWHHALSPAELEENRAVGVQAAEFMVGAARYVEDPHGYCEEHALDPGASFDELFPPPDPETISATIMRFVEKVELAYDTLQSILDDSE
ncbi:hypothetical protein PYCCODRAFT_1453609 [Trametes coccinea BRFM310]|uniref:Uncharacterized protein n=1 Tax=Trametes coccinea (strain BRFM310) TaxID=1353009 RepID=A0A1Y2IF18_TRAC3|nr:hypothetical protein PYCCODRAFT_1453609 [Trametes coccinea BRFM310]